MPREDNLLLLMEDIVLRKRETFFMNLNTIKG